MNIWIINHYAIPPSMGGLVRHYYFSKYLQEKGHTVKIFTSSKIHNSDINMISTKKQLFVEKMCDGTEYTFVRNSDYKGNGLDRILNMLQFPMNIRKTCKKFGKPDVIYTSSPDIFTAIAAVRIAKKLKVKCVVEVRDLWPESIVSYNNIKKSNPIIKILYRLEKWLYKKADKLIFTMEGGKQYIQDKGWDKSIDLSKVYHINNGIDLEEFEMNKKKYIIEDEDLLNDEYFKVIYTGSIRKVNNLETLVECAKICAKNNKKIKFFIYGEGTEKDSLIKKCAENHLSNIIFKGAVSKQYIPYILSNANVNLMHWKSTELMQYGCSANKLFDYLASGKPILYDVNISYDIIERYKCGFKTKNQSSAAIYETIISIANIHEDEVKKIGKNCKSCIQLYDYKELSNNLEKILKESVL